jgi:hypothetical protein
MHACMYVCICAHTFRGLAMLIELNVSRNRFSRRHTYTHTYIHPRTRICIHAYYGNTPQIRPYINTQKMQYKPLPVFTDTDAHINTCMHTRRVTQVQSLEGFTCLERLFVSSNRISSLDALRPFFTSKSLVELALDGNPVTAESNYRQVYMCVCVCV